MKVNREKVHVVGKSLETAFVGGDNASLALGLPTMRYWLLA